MRLIIILCTCLLISISAAAQTGMLWNKSYGAGKKDVTIFILGSLTI